MQTNWETFDIVTDDEIYNCEAKVYSEGSEYGINNGRVSKLYVKEWEIHGQPVFKIICAEIDHLSFDKII